jgi:hypothetical protein
VLLNSCQLTAYSYQFNIYARIRELFAASFRLSVAIKNPPRHQAGGLSWFRLLLGIYPREHARSAQQPRQQRQEHIAGVNKWVI